MSSYAVHRLLPLAQHWQRTRRPAPRLRKPRVLTAPGIGLVHLRVPVDFGFTNGPTAT